jgi:hypothetical protein
MTELAEYETPRASVRGVFLCENVAAGCPSPVKGVTLEEWSDVEQDPEKDFADLSIQTQWD